ncbi:MAG: ctaD, partial [Rubritepida sp.]|nr:ctaD [Rubritepida sp.]
MAYSADAHGHDDHGHHTPSFVNRWLFSTNHKDIGTLYIIFSLFAAVIGIGLSFLMRLELQQPGMQIFSDGQMWNAFVSAHGLIMVFFVIM